MSKTVLDRLRDFHPDLTAIRRDIHAHPELGMEEVRTSALVAQTLRDWGLTVTEGVGRFGVVATLKGRLPGQRAIGLRADMDALAINEQTGAAHASTTPGIMHACGHDGHTTMLLGAARYLAENPDFGGTVQFIFQPAEEGRGGAKAMLADGLFDRFPVDAVYGLHNDPAQPAGHFGTRPGPLMAAGDRWSVTFRGSGGHGGAGPHLANDLTVVQAHFVLGVQSIIARNVPATESAVLSVGYLGGGDIQSVNVMPAEVTIAGVGRSYRESVRDVMETRLRALAEGLAALHGATAEVAYNRRGIAVVNHDAQTEVAVAAATAVAGAEGVDANAPPRTGGEDFAAMMQERPGAFMFIGNGIGPGVHTPHYDFNDEIIPLGAAYWVSLVQQELAWGGAKLS